MSHPQIVFLPTRKIPDTPITAKTQDHIYFEEARGMAVSQGQIIDSGNACTVVDIIIDVLQSGHL